jgi:cytochrome c oxidase assembly protein subunit 15
MKWARRFAIITAVGMFIVLLMGARVTATGSGEGCGTDWPLCHGEWLPADTYESLTEYSHRFVTGIEGIFVLVTVILAWPLRKQFPSFKLLVPGVGLTLVVQSLMGAAAVKWPTSPQVMATHFGISLICLGSASLIALVLMEAKNGQRERPRLPASQQDALKWFRWLLIITFVFSIVVAYTGAYVRHTGSELACTSWPTCSGSLATNLDPTTPEGTQTIHRLSAGIISLMILGMTAIGWSFREVRRDLWWIAVIALINVLIQSLVGRWVVYSGLALMATLTHAALMSTLFVTMAEGIRRTWPVKSARAVSSERLTSPQPTPAPGD